MSAMKTLSEELSKERLLADLKSVVSQAEEFVQAATTQSGEKLTIARAKMEAGLQAAREKLDDAEANVVAKAKEAVDTTERSIKDHPWGAVSVSAGIGLLVGILIGRR